MALSCEVENQPRFPSAKADLKEALLLLLLALNAVTCPGHSLQALRLHFLVTDHALPVAAVLQAFQGLVNQLQQAAIIVTLVKEGIPWCRNWLLCPRCLA